MIGNVNVPGALAADIANKVDKVSGKGLSSNDFTDGYKSKLDNIDTVVTSNSDNLVTSNAVYNALTQNQSDLFSYIAIFYTKVSNTIDGIYSTIFIGRDENEFKTQFKKYFTTTANSYNLYIYGKENSYLDISSIFSNRNLYNVDIYFMNKFILRPDASYAFGETCTLQNSSGPTIDFSNIDTSNVTNMSYMFSYKNSGNGTTNTFTSLDLTSFNTSNVTDMSHMFYTANRLYSLKLGPGWDMRNVEDKTNMFTGFPTSGKVYYCDTNDTYNQLIAAGLPSSRLVLRTDIEY